MTCGIDEAGRGPVLGPLVVAGVSAPEADGLVAMGVRDSKRLAPQKRDQLARLIQEAPDIQVAVRVISPESIDAEMQHATLNDIELARFAEVAAELDDADVIADAADVDADRFARRLAERLPTTWTVNASHGADDRHPEVAAASIIAKTTRDTAIRELGRRLERQLGRELGSGYPGDATTQAFLRNWVEVHGELPPGTRRSWKTSKRLMEAARSPRLDSF